MIIALDGMGGDNAPEEIIKGALKSIEAFDDIHIQIFGDEKAIAPYLKEHDRITVIHCTEIIEPDDEPVEQSVVRKMPPWFAWQELLKMDWHKRAFPRGILARLWQPDYLSLGESRMRPRFAPTLPTVDKDL